MNIKMGRGQGKEGGREEETRRERESQGRGGKERDCNYEKISVFETVKKSHSGFPSFSDGHGTYQVLHTYYVPSTRLRCLLISITTHQNKHHDT